MTFEKFIEKIKNAAVEYDEDNEELICIAGVGICSKIYIPYDTFFEASMEYMSDKMNDEYTDANNTLNIYDAYNCIYIDLDYYLASDMEKTESYDDYIDATYSIMDCYISAMKKALNTLNIVRYYFLSFVPEELSRKYIGDESKNKLYDGSIDAKGKYDIKSGAHIFYMFKNDMSCEQRMNIYDEMNKQLTLNTLDLKVKTVTEAGKNILDIQRFKIPSMLMPFGQKNKGSRRYIIAINEYASQTWFVNPHAHTRVDNDLLTTGEPIPEPTDPEILRIRESFRKAEQEVFASSSNTYAHVLGLFGKLGTLMYEFIASLQYADKSNIIWKILVNHDDRLRMLILPTVRMFRFAHIVQRKGVISETIFKDNMTNLIIHMFQPLLMIATGKDEQTHRTEKESIVGNMKFVYDRIYNTDNSQNDVFVLEDIYGASKSKPVDTETDKENNSRLSTITKELEVMHHKLDSILDDINTAEDKKTEQTEAKKDVSRTVEKIKRLIDKKNKLSFDIQRMEDKKQRMEAETEGILDPDLNKQRNYDLLHFYHRQNYKIVNRFPNDKGDWNYPFKLEMFQKKCSKIIYAWTSMIRNTIKLGFLYEIEPFIERKDYEMNPRNNGSTFTDMVATRNSTDEYEVFMNDNNKSVYVKTMKCWCQMFMFVELYETRQMKDSVREVITTFIKGYIYNYEGTLLIYNIRQSPELSKYPYNQWLTDVDRKLTTNWLSVLYNKFIKTLLETSYREDGLEVLLNAVCSAIGRKDLISFYQLTTPNNIGTEIPLIIQNIITTHPIYINVPPKRVNIETDPYFPMRSCILEFKRDGSYDVRTNNRDIYIGSYTLIKYEDPKTYNFKSSAYLEMDKLIEQIYPIKEERLYNMRLFSTILTGAMTKDIFHIMYGGGSDGKTTMCNILEGAFGSSGNGRPIQEKCADGIMRDLINPRGLVSTGSAISLLVGNSNKSHDECGLKELTHVRLCVMQEPPIVADLRLNGNTIKTITSGGNVLTRGIYEKSESSMMNVLTVLQTNKIPMTDDISYGFSRRLSVYHHVAKFISDKNEFNNKYKYLKYKHLADSRLVTDMAVSPDHHAALFQILLPVIRDILHRGWSSSQSIPKPESILFANRKMISESNVVTEWMHMSFQESDSEKFTVFNVRTLINDMMDDSIINDELFKTSGKSDKSVQARNKILCENLEGVFSGYIYKLRDEFIQRRGVKIVMDTEVEALNTNMCILHKDDTDKGYKERYGSMTDREFKDKYLEDDAKPDFRTTNNHKDLYIIGFEYTRI